MTTGSTSAIAHRLFDWFLADHWTFGEGEWLEQAAPGILSGNLLHLSVDYATGDVARLDCYHRTVKIATVPRLDISECRRLAVQHVRRWAGVRDAWLDEPRSQQGPELSHLRVSSDASGVQRLTALVPVFQSRLSHREYDALPLSGRKAAAERAWVFVDAVNGECASAEWEPAERHRVDSELVPYWSVGTKLFGRDLIGPLFPVRLRGGTPYVYVQYLQSFLWRGEVETTTGGTGVTYGGRHWHVSADATTVTDDGGKLVLAHPPVVIAGYLYLPPELIKAITGWTVEYVKQSSVVYTYLDPSGTPAEPKDPPPQTLTPAHS